MISREEFSKRVNDPKHTEADLRQMYENALKSKEPTYAAIAKEVLDRRFPARIKRKGGRPKPATARVQNNTRRFSSTVQAFEWLVASLMEHSPAEFVGLVYIPGLEGRSRRYLARSIPDLFIDSPHLASDSNNYVCLSNDWYLITNLSNREKFEIAARVAAKVDLAYPADWALDSDDPTESLQIRIHLQEVVERLRKEL